jgi:hypothetical protein
VIWLKWALHRRRIEFGLRRQLPRNYGTSSAGRV